MLSRIQRRRGLLNEALFQAMADWGSRIGGALAPDPDVPDAPAAQFESKLARLIDSFADNRQSWLASLEAFTRSQRSPELRTQLTAGQPDGGRGAGRPPQAAGLSYPGVSTQNSLPSGSAMTCHGTEP
jgi:hypothetical protein